MKLLVIDLGDSCVVKVEEGQFDMEPFIFPGDKAWALSVSNYPYVIKQPFIELRAVIDAVGEKPLPRIERVPDDLHEGYEVYTLFSRIGNTDLTHVIQGDRYEALCELAGHPLPIYEPKQGKWTQLIPFTLNDMYSGGDPTTTSQIDGGTGIKVWRYERND